MLRDEYAAQTRQRIIENFIALLEESEDNAVSTSALAKKAGVSLRTVYRHFPSRDDLLGATAEWLNTEIFGLVSGDDTQDLVKGFRTAAEKFDSRPTLARILALTRVGRSMRSTFRNDLALQRRRLLWRDAPGISESDRLKAEAVLACLDNVLSWLTLSEEFGMDGKDIGTAIGWAMELVLRETRRGSRANRDRS
ncbi:TetR/AcrR family transcriptional regulator [Acetobacter oeni]|uniref:Transcriptional regulator n=1 Tax=Acetobacter oeni TaxID=304077 RepID=A0A511XPC7_9PROT|nr:TetR/AcrR family transcriptional regulator [Acetobacter oeni]MBB3882848.1 AcrR family transcriptional regulator [Acetobacter oeni]NHO18933.1 TetR family transcriptional regulator [Acetobacter oeni]GBR03714.1 TetR family transcriptional regulator [Acetobacter oeni LMG 21952]GEN64759.1 transcriptional regulator [Acetobacter oeni]